MAYTPSGDKVGGEIFGGSVVDANRVALSGVPNNMSSIDATGVPQNSPLTVNTTATLVVPQNAISVTISSVTNAVQVTEDSTYTAYFSLPAGVPWTFPCARQQNIYLKTGSSTVVSFQFNTV